MEISSAVFLGSIAFSLLRSRYCADDNLEKDGEVDYIVVQGDSGSYVDLGAFTNSSSSSSGGGLRKGSFPSDVSLGKKVLVKSNIPCDKRTYFILLRSYTRMSFSDSQSFRHSYYRFKQLKVFS